MGYIYFPGVEFTNSMGKNYTEKINFKFVRKI